MRFLLLVFLVAMGAIVAVPGGALAQTVDPDSVMTERPSFPSTPT